MGYLGKCVFCKCLACSPWGLGSGHWPWTWPFISAAVLVPHVPTQEQTSIQLSMNPVSSDPVQRLWLDGWTGEGCWATRQAFPASCRSTAKSLENGIGLERKLEELGFPHLSVNQAWPCSAPGSDGISRIQGGIALTPGVCLSSGSGGWASPSSALERSRDEFKFKFVLTCAPWVSWGKTERN